jgi:hypothetical protein
MYLLLLIAVYSDPCSFFIQERIVVEITPGVAGKSPFERGMFAVPVRLVTDRWEESANLF